MISLFFFSLFRKNNTPNGRKKLSLGVSIFEAMLTFPIFFLFVIFLIDCARFFLVLTVLNYACFNAADFASKVEVEANTTIPRCSAVQSGDPQDCYDYYQRVQRILQRALNFALLVATDSQTPSSSRLIRFRHYNPALYPANTKNASGIRPSGFNPTFIDSDVAYLRPGEAVERLGGEGGTFQHPLRPLGLGLAEGWPDTTQAESWDSVLKQIPFVVHAEVDFNFFLPGIQNVTIPSSQYGFRRTGARGVQGPPLQFTTTPAGSPMPTSTRTITPSIPATLTATRTNTPVGTSTRTSTPTITLSPTVTNTPTITLTGTRTRTPTKTPMPTPTTNCGYCAGGPTWYTWNQSLVAGTNGEDSCEYCNDNCGQPCWAWPGCQALCIAHYGIVSQCESAGDNCIAPTRTPTASRTVTLTITGTISTATRTYTRTPTKTYTVTGTPTITNTPRPSSTRTITATPTATFATHTPTLSPTITLTRTKTATRTITSTFTPTITSTATFTPTNTRTITPSPTRTITPTSTVTVTRSPTITPTFLPTPTPTYTATIKMCGPVEC